MTRPYALLEPMDMPDPYLPIKVHYCSANGYGKALFANHWHEQFEMIYVLSGSVLIEINSIPHALEAGEIAVVNSNDLHAGVCLSDNLAYYALIADLSLLHSPTPGPVETKFITPMTQNRIVFHHKLKAPDEIGGNILAVVRELNERELGYELSLKSLLFRILTLLLRQEVDNVVTEDNYLQRMRKLERFAPVLQEIEMNYREELNIERLAAQAGLSRFHFSRLFKELTGRTAMEYINGIRLNRAEYLLCNTDLTITEIAYECGFHDIYYFSRKFKREKAMAPSVVRKQKGL